MNNTLLNELTETFERLSAVYNELLETAKTKQRYLMSGDIEGLETILYREKNHLEFAHLLEQKRQHIINSYCRESDIYDNKITMKSLLKHLDNLQREKVETLMGTLTETIKELQGVNKTNTTLTNYSLEVTEDIMRIFCPPAFQHQTYHASGKKSEHEMSMVLIDTKI